MTQHQNEHYPATDLGEWDYESIEEAYFVATTADPEPVEIGGLADDYETATEQFRRGVNAAMIAITGYTLPSIAEQARDSDVGY
jgi:hypothetical protein